MAVSNVLVVVGGLRSHLPEIHPGTPGVGPARMMSETLTFLAGTAA